MRSLIFVLVVSFWGFAFSLGNSIHYAPRLVSDTLSPHFYFHAAMLALCSFIIIALAVKMGISWAKEKSEQ
jgi:hypothetical protein